jgi:hypothetical protein
MTRRGIPNRKHRTPADTIEMLSVPEPNSGCWLWLGSVNKAGYGRLGKDKRERQAHRLSYSVHRGEIPKGVLVLHRCDVRCCVNPSHLFLGSHADNAIDRESKGRGFSMHGAEHPKAKLSWDAANSIRQSHETSSALARKFGVSHKAVRLVRSGKTWVR